MFIKSNTRILVRKLLQSRDQESIPDTIARKKVKLKKKLSKKKYSKLDLYEALVNSGIKQGDTLMVHAAWREFYNFSGSPSDVIDILISVLGKDGTLLMPSYGKDKFFFNVKETPSSAGVLSEVFRSYPNVIRSECTNFSICGLGKNASSLTKYHFKSSYGFDEYSPYYKMTELENSKILFLGLGKKPTKISLFHFAGYILRDELDFYTNIYTNSIQTTLITNDGLRHDKTMTIRNPTYKNNNKSFKLIYDHIKKKRNYKLSNLDIVSIDAKEGLAKSIELAKSGIYCYKKNKLRY